MISRNFIEVVLKIIGKFFVDVFVHKFGRFNFVYVIDFEDFMFIIQGCYVNTPARITDCPDSFVLYSL